MGNHALRPGGLVDAILFFAGLLLGIAGPITSGLHGLTEAARTRELSSASFIVAIAWIMPVVFGKFQRRYDREGVLSPRRPALLGSFVAGAPVGVAYYAVARIGGSMGWPLFVAAGLLPWCASRVLWRTAPD